MLSVVITLRHNKQSQAQKQAVTVAAMVQQSVQSLTACQIGGNDAAGTNIAKRTVWSRSLACLALTLNKAWQISIFTR